MAKRTHYETIGVDPKASPKEIKRVFLDKAKHTHPDTATGDESEMMALNHAYNVLSDPKRRTLYDETGKDSELPREAQVNGLVMTAFLSALQADAPNVLIHAKKVLEEGQATLRQQQRQITEGRDKLKSRREKISRKKGPNAFHMIIDQQLAAMDQAEAKVKDDLEVCKEAIDELKKYKSTEDVVQVYSMNDLRFGNMWTTVQVRHEDDKN